MTAESKPVVGSESEAAAVPSEQHPPAEARPVAAEDPPAAVSRRPSADVAREVYARDNEQCTFITAGGQRCGTRDFLEFDHIDPAALGGEPTASNLRLRCRAHNQRYARQCYGEQHMATAVARARRKKENAA